MRCCKLITREAIAIVEFERNHLIAALPEETFRRWMPHLDRTYMAAGAVLYEPKEASKFVYFPANATISLLYVLESGASAEVAVVGCEGMVGMAVLMGGLTANRALVQSGGELFRMGAEYLAAEIEQSGEVLHLLLRYLQALLTQTAQTAVCMRFHDIEQQLCRWLLLCLDRVPSPEISMTQQTIAGMLAIRRERVTQAALALQEAGLIRTLRGRITVLDRIGLESRACECYAMIKKEYRRLLPTRVRPGP